jgi:hypothetical protein
LGLKAESLRLEIAAGGGTVVEKVALVSSNPSAAQAFSVSPSVISSCRTRRSWSVPLPLFTLVANHRRASWKAIDLLVHSSPWNARPATQNCFPSESSAEWCVGRFGVSERSASLKVGHRIGCGEAVFAVDLGKVDLQQLVVADGAFIADKKRVADSCSGELLTKSNSDSRPYA